MDNTMLYWMICIMIIMAGLTIIGYIGYNKKKNKDE